jgi:Ca-activated chloride channel homolog
MFRFAVEKFLYLLLLIPLFGLFFIVVFKEKNRAMKRFGNIELVKKLSQATSRARQVTKIVFLLSAIVFIVFALARPQVGTKLEEVKREGVDIIIAIDVSKSMLAQDIPPNRLAKAKHEVETFLTRLQGDRIGLVAFAGVAFVQCPLTLDYGAAKIFLDILDPSLIPVAGTDIGDAIKKAMEAFERKERKHKVLILITDGESHEGDALKVAEEAEKEGIVIYCVGIGSPSGQPIPEMDEGGRNSGFKKDRQGEVVITKLDEITLEKIALQTGGKYWKSSTGEDELEKIYEEISKMEKKELGSLQFSQFEDRFQYVLICAIFFLVFEIFISERKGIKHEWFGRFM